MPTEPTLNGRLTCLVSYVYLRELNDDTKVAWLFDNPDPIVNQTEWMIDSGAFTAKNTGAEVTYDEYVAFIRRWGDKVKGYIALDVVGDAAGTWHNLERMWADGLTPIPVHTLYDDQDALERMYDHATWVALAGLRRPHRGLASVQFVARKHAMTRGRRAHWLGYTKHSMVNTLRPYSVDSASLNAGAMWGRCQLWLAPGRMSSTLMAADVKKLARERDTRLIRLLDILDIDATWLAHDDAYKRTVHKGRPPAAFTIHRLNKLSWVMYARDLRQHIGTRMFLACRADHFGWVFDAWNRINGGPSWMPPKWQQM